MTKMDRIIEGVQKRFYADFKYISSQYGYGLEKGIAREEVVVDFLRRYLPASLHLGPGIIIDPEGHQSKPQDIVVFDGHNYPTFPLSGAHRLFPREGVKGVIQVKSELNSPEIRDGIANVKSAKILVSQTGERAFGVLLAFSSGVKGPTALRTFASENDVYLEPYRTLDRIYVFGKYGLEYKDDDRKGQLRAKRGHEIVGLYTKKYTLLHFYRYLLAALNIPQTSEWKTRDYIDHYFTERRFKSFRLPEEQED